MYHLPNPQIHSAPQPPGLGHCCGMMTAEQHDVLKSNVIDFMVATRKENLKGDVSSSVNITEPNEPNEDVT